jgi:hypothetical protein
MSGTRGELPYEVKLSEAARHALRLRNHAALIEGSAMKNVRAVMRAAAKYLETLQAVAPPAPAPAPTVTRRIIRFK